MEDKASIEEIFKCVTINDKRYDKRELLEACRLTRADNHKESWEKDIWFFIEELLSNDDQIRVKSSGTTGKPKEVGIFKHELAESALRTQRYFQLRPGQKALLCLPVKFIAGKMMIVRAFVSGLNLITVKPSGDPFVELDSFIDFAALTPFQLGNALSSLTDKNMAGTIIVGGAKITDSMFQKISGLTCRVVETFGMTETSSHIAVRPLNGPGRSYWFEVLEGIKIDTDQRGCLSVCFISTNKEVVTNDLVTIKANRFLWLGRIDNVINSGGVKIIPEQVEKKLSKHLSFPFLISRVPDEKLGEKPALIIENENYDDIDKTRVCNIIRMQLEKLEQPGIINVVPYLERTLSGKIKRPRQWYPDKTGNVFYLHDF